MIMNHRFLVIAAVLPLFAVPAAQAADAAGTITQLSGWVLSVKANGRPKALSVQSKVEVGDTLVSQGNSFVRLTLDDGNEALLGPDTRVKVEQHSPGATELKLAAGSLQVISGAGRFTIAAGQTTVDARAANFIVRYQPPAQSAAAARQLYARTSLALASAGALTDAGADLPLSEVIAQVAPPASKGALAPGLYVHVIDGLINLSNKGGTQNFNAGQFGFVASLGQPPIVIPPNPGLRFSPPPAFSSTSGSTGAGAGAGKSGGVDCEVR
jgi:hypothetical protein